MTLAWGRCKEFICSNVQSIDGYVDEATHWRIDATMVIMCYSGVDIKPFGIFYSEFSVVFLDYICIRCYYISFGTHSVAKQSMLDILTVLRSSFLCRCESWVCKMQMRVWVGWLVARGCVCEGVRMCVCM